MTRADIDFHEEWNRAHGAMSLGTGADGDGDDDSGDDGGEGAQETIGERNDNT